MSYQRRHSRWYERVLFNPIVLLLIGTFVSVLAPALDRWGWEFWFSLDPARVNTLVGVFITFPDYP